MAEGDRFRSPTPPPPHLDPTFPLFVEPDFFASVVEKKNSARVVYRLWPFLDMTLYLFDDHIYFRSKSISHHNWLLHCQQYNFMMEKYAEMDKAVDECIHQMYGNSLVLDGPEDYQTGQCFLTLDVTWQQELKFHTYCPSPGSGAKVGYPGPLLVMSDMIGFG